MIHGYHVILPPTGSGSRMIHVGRGPLWLGNGNWSDSAPPRNLLIDDRSRICHPKKLPGAVQLGERLSIHL